MEAPVYRYLLSAEFKGDRSYLQGPDLFNVTLEWINSNCKDGDVRDIDMAFHRLTHNQVAISLEDAKQGNELPLAVCAFTNPEGRKRVYLFETTDPVVGRHPYPEEEVIAGAYFDLSENRVFLVNPSAYTDIEVWVALTKALHQRVYKDLGGKWLFVRGKFPRYVRERQAGERVLAIVSNFQNKLTRSEAFVDGEKVGEIYFSLAEGKPHAGD